MQPEPWMTTPSWFLVTGLPWPEDQAGEDIAEAAFAIAPDVTQRIRPIGADGGPIALGEDLALMLNAGSRCANALSKRLVFVSDITRWLSDIGLSWERMGIGFEIARNDLEQQTPGIYVTVSQKAHAIICSAARTLTIHYLGSGTVSDVTAEDRELVRTAVEERLDADWPAYITQVLTNAPPPPG